MEKEKIDFATITLAGAYDLGYANAESKMRLALGGMKESELWGDEGLIAATMRCVEAVEKAEDEADKMKREIIILQDWIDIYITRHKKERIE